MASSGWVVQRGLVIGSVEFGTCENQLKNVFEWLQYFICKFFATFVLRLAFYNRMFDFTMRIWIFSQFLTIAQPIPTPTPTARMRFNPGRVDDPGSTPNSGWGLGKGCFRVVGLGPTTIPRHSGLRTMLAIEGGKVVFSLRKVRQINYIPDPKSQITYKQSKNIGYCLTCYEIHLCLHIHRFPNIDHQGNIH